MAASLLSWIAADAPWPDETVAGESAPPTNHWAFKSPIRPPLPQVLAANFAVRNPIDAFIAKKHADFGLQPSPEADRRTLVRRLALDLTGLPPTLEEDEIFLSDQSPDAYEKLVERFLGSTHYGERWGRFWLDLARWSESDGYEANEFRPSAWRYRDYVVKSFNDDKPYDFFLRQQIAGDEMTPYSDENLIATGFLAGTRNNNNEEDKLVQVNEPLVDIVNTTAAVTLGLTLNCAQCHDHKFDPLTSQDYYRFQGFFVRGQVNNLLLRDPDLWRAYDQHPPTELQSARDLFERLYGPQREKLAWDARKKLPPTQLDAFKTPIAERTDEQTGLAQQAEKQLNISDEDLKKSLLEDEQPFFNQLKSKIAELEKKDRLRKPHSWAFYSPASLNAVTNLPPRGMYPFPYDTAKLKTKKPIVLKRGDVHRPGDEVEAGWPSVLGATPPGLLNQMPRLALVDWLTSPANPLTARVWANYVWQQHFGRGIVATPSDFGTRGAKPAHPELLDWLATELIRAGWSTKHIHRLIVLSSTYRQASRPNADNAKADPENIYLWRWMPRRLESEAIRDEQLAVTDELDRTMGGPSIPLHEADQKLRRSLYLRQKRFEQPLHQAIFDAPSAIETCPRRHVSTVPLQPLYLLNDEFVLDRARQLARRVFERAGTERPRQIETAFRLALGRSPDAEEASFAHEFFARVESALPVVSTVAAHGTNAPEKPDRPSLALVQFCHSLLNLNEFICLQ